MEDSLYFSEQHLAVRNMVREFARGRAVESLLGKDAPHRLDDRGASILAGELGRCFHDDFLRMHFR